MRVDKQYEEIKGEFHKSSIGSVEQMKTKEELEKINKRLEIIILALVVIIIWLVAIQVTL